MWNNTFQETASLFTGLPVWPSPKFGFRSSMSKNRHPGEGGREGLVPRDFLLHGYFLYLGRFPFSQNFRNFWFGGKWNTFRRLVPLENSQKKWKI